MTTWVNGDGSSSAKLIIVGESPGKSEVEQGLPFVGPSGQLVNEMLTLAGINREECYVTNVVKVRPPDNDLTRLKEIGHNIDEFIPILWNEVEAIQPNAILALGDLALKTLTGKQGITKYRGSILSSIKGFPKVVPSIHPANLLEHRKGGMFHWRDKTYIQLDFNKAVRESTFKDFKLPKRELWVCKSSYNLIKFLERNQCHAKLALDIETYKATPLCIGLAFTKDEAISIPLVDLLSDINPDGITLTEMTNIWKILLEVLRDEKIKKIGQNFKFDEFILRGFGFNISGFNSDTMLKFHTLYPEFPKSLEFQTSIFTEEPYYKSEGREYNPKKDELSRLLLYNAKDAAVTRELDDILERELEEAGLVDYFYREVMPLHYLYMNIESNGLLLNKQRYKDVVEKYVAKSIETHKKLNELIGYEINPDSNPSVCNLLYNELNLPPRVRRRASGKSTLTADEEALMTLLANVKMGEKKKEIIKGILKYRGVNKTLGTYLGQPKYGK